MKNMQHIFWKEASESFHKATDSINKIQTAIESLKNLPKYLVIDYVKTIEGLDEQLHYAKQDLEQAQKDCDKHRGLTKATS